MLLPEKEGNRTFIDQLTLLLLLFAAVDDVVSEPEAGFVNACSDLLLALCGGLEGDRPALKADEFVTRPQTSAPPEEEPAPVEDKPLPPPDLDQVLAELDALCGPNHQGIAALAACKETVTLDELFAAAEAKGEPPFFVVCDELEDPHNLGAILRTAETAGVHGVVIPKRRSAGLTSAVYKASAGAVEYVPVARVSNITDALREMKKRGVWVYGLDMDGETWCSVDMKGAAAVVVGSEGRGISRLVKEQCDFIVSLPMRGHITSLNASVACGIVLYEAARQRQGLAAK